MHNSYVMGKWYLLVIVSLSSRVKCQGLRDTETIDTHYIHNLSSLDSTCLDITKYKKKMVTLVLDMTKSSL